MPLNFAQNPRVGPCYRLVKFIGSGSFGRIFRGINEATKEDVAIKFELSKSSSSQLFFEARLLHCLMQLGELRGFPKIYWWGTEGDYAVMVFELLGPSLADLFAFCGHQFSLKTTLLLAIQMISRIEILHEINFLHRDVKPDNFLIGLNKNSHCLYLIDFGLSKRYRDLKEYHISLRHGRTLTGTLRYCSLNAHFGYELSRRDDLEAIGYIMVYFLQGSLPWQGINGLSKKSLFNLICQIKLGIPLKMLCRGLPQEILIYIQYCRSLKFVERPDYAYLRQLLENLFILHGLEADYIYDWTILQLYSASRKKSEPKENILKS